MNEHDESVRAPYLTGDVRDDFDDEFGSPSAESIRRRLLLPAIAIILLGVVGLFATLSFETSLIELTFFTGGLSPPSRYVGFLALSAIVAVCAAVMVATIAGGVGMLRLRHHGLADFAVVVFVGVTLLGVVTVILAPLGLWAWVTLNDRDVRREFERRRT